jgi:nucleotide-binding universal stress UspA family protein
MILLPLDGSKAALAALPVAHLISSLKRAPLRILHVTEQARPPLGELVSRLGVSPATLRSASIEARSGEPADSILEAAQERRARVIVLCTHSAPRRPADVLGGTALAVFKQAVCPVVFVDPELGLESWGLRTVLVPNEGAPAEYAAVREGAELAQQAGAELVFLQVASAGTTVPHQQGSFGLPVYLDQPQHEWPSWTGEFMERLACVCSLAGLRVRLLIGRGAPRAEIVRVARERSADLVVLSWKGRWAPSRAETLKAILNEAPSPVMAVRAP